MVNFADHNIKAFDYSNEDVDLYMCLFTAVASTLDSLKDLKYINIPPYTSIPQLVSIYIKYQQQTPKKIFLSLQLLALPYFKQQNKVFL